MRDRSDAVFHLQDENLTPLPARSMRDGLLGRTLEDALQTLFEKYPEILPGKQMEPGSDDPPRFVLLHREMPVGGWSLDHLFVDQRGTLTLVETKLFENPESRREVIGQIIEYAANAADSWSEGNVRQKATEFWSNKGKELDEVLQEAFNAEHDSEEFWREVEENLTNGRLRLIIATDELRPEVRRMIEYLNREMQNAQVLGLELNCYGEDSESVVLVPRLVGQTQSIVDRKSGSTVKWTAERLMGAYAELSNQELGRRLKKVLDWAVQRGMFMTAITMNPTFGVKAMNQKRLVSFFGDGNIHCVLAEKDFPGDTAKRDRFVDELKAVGLLDQALDPHEVVSGRTLIKNLSQFGDEEIDNLLKIFSEYYT